MRFHFLSHFNLRPPATQIDTVVVHSMYAANSNNPLDELACIKLLDQEKVSAHYLINTTGEITQLVPEQKRAWHAGVSKLPYAQDARENVNDFSIGIELIALSGKDFPLIQYNSLSQLILQINSRYQLKYVVGHDQIAAGRKQDPGPRFDWQKLTYLCRTLGLISLQIGIAGDGK